MEPLAILVGPTAVGKTALSLPIAQALHAEILNVDSRQLYRYMDIGTAKPTWTQRQQVRHHLLDLLSPDQSTSAAQFRQTAACALADIRNRGKRALVVAGSGLYLQALLYGLMPVPAAQAPLRQAFHTHADRHGTHVLHRWLARLDPDAAALYHPHDRLRLVRALEVIFLTGEPFSAHRRRHQQQGPLLPFVAVALTRNRAELFGRIADRTDAMLAAGWLEEVDALVAREYTHTCAAMNSLGYQELLAYREGHMAWADAVATIKKRTRLLAKRQLTWFRKMPGLIWVDLSVYDEETAVKHILAILQHPASVVGRE